MDSIKGQLNLSHWDFAESFSGQEAAALILGIEPKDSQCEQWRVRIVFDRMKIHYEATRERLFIEAMRIVPREFLPALMPHLMEVPSLISVKMMELLDFASLADNRTKLAEWLEVDEQAKFENQKFSRNSLIEWLDLIEMKSAYQFSRRSPVEERLPDCKWPWGSHHTEALGHLEAAARRFWTNYDPSDPSTANKNDTVSEWLQSERNVSKTMANAIASILRPDGLPTGPR